MAYYHIAQVCLNGHCINDRADHDRERNSKHCSKCGAATITECPSCKTAIRGYYHVEGVAVLGWRYNVPACCHECGAKYPWTEAAIRAAQELINEEETVPASDKEALIEVLPNLVVDTPQTSIAVRRLQKFVLKAGTAIGDVLKDVLVSFTVEAAKKGLGW